MSEASIEILRLSKVMAVVSASRTTIYQWMKDGAFPLPYHLGPRNVGWRSDEIQDWIKALPRVDPNDPVN